MVILRLFLFLIVTFTDRTCVGIFLHQLGKQPPNIFMLEILLVQVSQFCYFYCYYNNNQIFRRPFKCLLCTLRFVWHWIAIIIANRWCCWIGWYSWDICGKQVSSFALEINFSNAFYFNIWFQNNTWFTTIDIATDLNNNYYHLLLLIKGSSM